jgi:hypothetical protein
MLPVALPVEEEDLDRMCFVTVRFPVGRGPFSLNGGRKGAWEGDERESDEEGTMRVGVDDDDDGKVEVVDVEDEESGATDRGWNVECGMSTDG